jgi:hypothetical protein
MEEDPMSRVAFWRMAIAILGMLVITQSAIAAPPSPPAPDPDCSNPNEELRPGSCLSGCTSCGSECAMTWAQIKQNLGLQLVDNIGWSDHKFDLIIYQQTNNGKGEADWFQWYAYQWLLGKAPAATHVAVSNIAQADAAIKAAFAANGNAPINVVIVGHGAPGLIKVGEEVLDKSNYVLLANVRNMIKRLVLFGCSVAGDDKAFVRQLAIYFGNIPVKSWTGTVWASTKGLYHEGEKNKTVPMIPAWGLAMVAVFLLTTATVVLRRNPTT